MLFTKSLYTIASVLLFSKVHATFNATSNSNVVYYWGQNSASAVPNDPEHKLWQKRLSHYCETEDADIFVVSFLHQFGQGRSTAFDLAVSGRECKGFIPGTQLMDCPQMEEDIKYCQSKNKKIILSMGGATPAYGIDSLQEGENLADELWDIFAGGGNSTTPRPFGNATVDGFDLDIENGAKGGYTAFVNKMRKNYETDKSKTYYMAAAPQCVFPDYFVGDTLDGAWFDFVFIQFYNNYCSVINPTAFNYDVWDNWSKTRSINKDVRLFVGIPGSPSAAGRGYVPYSQLVDTIKPLQPLESFGGVMIWDASQAFGNTQDILPNYAHGVTRLIKGDGNDTTPIEYAPTPVVYPTVTSTITTATTTITSTSVSDYIVTVTSTCTDVTTTLAYSTTESTITRAVPISESTGAYTESYMTTLKVISYNTTVPACPTQTLPSIPSTSNNSSLPQEGELCENEGWYKCSGPTSFAQCVYGRYVLRECAATTVCKENTPSTIFCDFP